MAEKNLKKVQKALKKGKFTGVEASVWRSSVRLEGAVDTWDQKIEAGFAAAKKGFKAVINDISVKGVPEEAMKDA
jgi:glycerol-3-phosphate dehydrogenase